MKEINPFYGFTREIWKFSGIGTCSIGVSRLFEMTSKIDFAIKFHKIIKEPGKIETMRRRRRGQSKKSSLSEGGGGLRKCRRQG